MSKLRPIEVAYKEPSEVSGRCTICGNVTQRYDWDNSTKLGAFSEMYCYRCGMNTTHTNVKKV